MGRRYQREGRADVAAVKDAAHVTVETLEARRMLSASLSANGTLVVNGLPGSKNVITVGLNSAGTSVDVTINRGAVQSFDATKVHLVQISGGAKKDTITIDQGRSPFSIATRIDGGAGKDKITAGNEADFILGGDGNDKIDAAGGDDNVDGGAGNDTIICGDGNDTADGGAGNDKIFGGNGNDDLVGGPGNDTIRGGNGKTQIFGGPGKNKLTGGSGTNAIYGGPGSNTITAFSSSDLVVPGSGRTKLLGAPITIDPSKTEPPIILPSPPDFYPEPIPPIDLDTGTVSGVVNDSSGKAVPFALVTLRTVQTDFGQKELAAAAAAGAADGSSGGGDASTGIAWPAWAYSVTADSKGKFMLEDVPTGDYVAVAARPGIGSASQNITVTKNQTTQLTLTLQPDSTEQGVGTVTGTVKDKDGHGVAGATVTLTPAFVGPMPLADGSGVSLSKGTPGQAGATAAAEIAFPYPGDSLQTVTDASGAFTIASVPAGDYTAFVGTPDGFARADVTVVKDQTANVALVLEVFPKPDPLPEPLPPPIPVPPPTDFGKVSGTVKDASGHAAQGVVVSLAPEWDVIAGGGGAAGTGVVASSAIASDPSGGGGSTPGEPGDPGLPPDPSGLVTKTDASGNFSLDNVPVGRYTIWAFAADGRSASASVTVSKGQTSTANLTLSSDVPVPMPLPGPLPPVPVQGDPSSLDGTVASGK